MKGFAALVVLATAFSSAWSEGTDCSDNNPYIKKIKEKWNEQAKVPTGIIEIGVNKGPDYLRFVSKGYRPDAECIDCIVTYWEGKYPYTSGSFTSHIKYKDNETPEILPTQYIEEKNGQTIQSFADGRMKIRTHLNTQEPEVSCLYTCDSAANPSDPPVGVCKVYSGYSPDALAKAKQELENILGVSLSEELCADC